jgi:protein ImuA
MAAKAREIIEGLRESIRRIERRPPPSAFFIPSGRPEVDALLPGGGFPRGALTELAGSRASGKTELALCALAAAMGEGGLAAYVDGRGELYPPAVARLGVDLERLLVIRPMCRSEARESVGLWAAEVVLASGAFEGVVVDVPIVKAQRPGPRPIDGLVRRLRVAAEKGGALALWLGAPDGARVSAAVRLELSAGATGWRVRRTFERGEGAAARGVDHAA